MRDLLAALAELRERLKEIPQADERRLSDLKTEILGRKAGVEINRKVLADLAVREPVAFQQLAEVAKQAL